MLTSDLAKELNLTVKDIKNIAKEFSIKITSGNSDLTDDETAKIRNFANKEKNPSGSGDRVILVQKSSRTTDTSGEKEESKKVRPVKKVKIKIKKVVKKVEEQPVKVSEDKTSKDKPPVVVVDKKETAEGDDKKDIRHLKKRTLKHEKTFPKEKEIRFQRERKKREQKAASSVPKSIDIMETISVAELAKKMNIKASAVIAKLMELGMMATINQIIDAETAQIVAGEYSCDVKIVSLYDETLIEEPGDEAKDLSVRPPIVTVMGHVDHGKTTLLDFIRKSKVAEGETGGITQHIGAYKVRLKTGEIVFLDTPGHEAFTSMRSRGAKITDLVILVVAADEGAMPQTIEALNHAKAAEVPILVAVNKMDSEGANPDKIKQQLSDHGLLPEDWGGDTQYIPVSAKTGEGVDDLLEAVILNSEILELKANPDRLATGAVIESRVDVGRGPVATILVKNGTLRVGDNFVAGIHSGRVRAMFNWEGDNVKEAGPSTPVEVLGLDGVPEAGDPFNSLEDDRTAKSISEKRHELNRFEQAKNVKKITLDNLYEAILEGNVAELRLVLKADVQGSVEAIKDALEKLSNQEVKVKVIHTATGGINENDVLLASASDAIIIGFHVRPNSRALVLAEKEGVDIRKYGIIYEVIDEVKRAMEGLLKPIIKEEVTGMVEVRKIFKVSKVGSILGCMVTSGKVFKNSRVRLIRDGIVIWEGELSSLKRFKDDAKEVSQGYECGLTLLNYNDAKEGDEIEAYKEVKVAKKLSEAKQKS
jgi:translation initiation factor IF-2